MRESSSDNKRWFGKKGEVDGGEEGQDIILVRDKGKEEGMGKRQGQRCPVAFLF